MIKVDLSYANLPEDLESYKDEVAKIHETIHNGTGAGNDFLGWRDLPTNYDKDEVARMKAKAESLSKEIDVLLVCGIGGSYLGARAAIEALNGLFPTNKVQMVYIGNTFSSTYLAQVKEYVKDKEFGINVISKSGTTTETSVSFRIFKELLEETKGKEVAARRIVATTDAHKGALKTLADNEGYEEYVVPDDVGGRFSVLTAVGLFPIAMAGIDIEEMLAGARAAQNDYNNPDLDTNDAYRYAVARHILGKKYPVEMFVTYEAQLRNFAEWWKQLFGESEGKEGKGVLPHSGVFSTDLHSLGQFIQEGSKVEFETVLRVVKPQLDLTVPSDPDNLDNLNYLAGKTVDYVNKKACEGTLGAHANVGGVPNIVIDLDELTAYSFGYMVYFFEIACALSVYMLGVNPFNQPGVEVYKKRMFHLLGKPGYEEL